MPKSTTPYEKVIYKARKINWTDTPEYNENFNYHELLKILNYSTNRIEIGKTHRPKTWDEYKQLLLEYDSYSKGVNLKKMIFVYGQEVGTKKFNNYCQKQSYTNTFEYKNSKYGMTKEEFDDYNKSRSVTLENLIKRHGEEKGIIKYKKYCEVQAYTNTIEHLGPEKYKRVNRLKSHTLSSYIERYGEILGPLKLKIHWERKSSTSRCYSTISQKCFKEIEKLLTDKEKKYLFYATKNKEYALLCEDRCFMYDFVCSELKMCIEYHGDHYHGNPFKYMPDDYLKGRGCTKIKAKEKWEYDAFKIDYLKKCRNYDTIVIWDSDWREKPDDIIEKVNRWIIKRRIELMEIENESTV